MFISPKWAKGKPVYLGVFSNYLELNLESEMIPDASIICVKYEEFWLPGPYSPVIWTTSLCMKIVETKRI
jgi:hypothetical protein